MKSIEADIQMLRLRVKNDTISWSFEISGRADSNLLLDTGEEQLEQSSLSRANINFLIEQLQLLADTSRVDQPQETTTTRLGKLVRLLGEHLYTILFKGQIHARLANALNQKELNLLRIELEFEDEELAHWPWEYLYMPRDKTYGSGAFLAEVTRLVLSRRLPLGTMPRKLSTAEPVRMLVVVSEPKDFPHIQCESILRAIQDLCNMKLVELKTLIEKFELSEAYQPTVTRKKVRRTMMELNPQIIHFIGHGRQIAESGAVALVTGGGESDWVSDTDFAFLVEGSKDLKLVFLQACGGTLLGPYSVSSMALQLARRNIPAVVAIQDTVTCETATTFVNVFYEALIGGQSVDRAVQAGRKAVSLELPNERQYLAFGSPVLYLSSYKSMIVRNYESMIAPEKITSSKKAMSPSRTEYTGCPRCNAPIAVSVNFCGSCGLSFVCRFCKKRLTKPLGKFCNECGQLINS